MSEDDKINIAVLQTKIENSTEVIGDLKDVIKELKEDLNSKFVTKSEFAPVRMVVYGGTGAVLLAWGGYYLGL